MITTKSFELIFVRQCLSSIIKIIDCEVKIFTDLIRYFFDQSIIKSTTPLTTTNYIMVIS